MRWFHQKFQSVIVIIPFFALVVAPGVQAQTMPFPSDSVQVNRCMQLRFTAARSYAKPYMDVNLWCNFRSPSGKKYRIAGFWQEGQTFLVRFAPNEAGMWMFTTECNYTQDLGLNSRVGLFTVLPYTGSNPLYKHGFLRVSDSKRTLAFADGTPFYYLADSPWEISWKSRIGNVERYLHDRKTKGFTAIQMVALSHQIMNFYGVINQADSPAFTDSSFTQPNARYFDYIDSLVTAINDSGLVVVMSPLWAPFAGPHNPTGPFHMRNPAANRWAHYMAARYAGHFIVWIIAGDLPVDTPEKVSFWNDFAAQVKEAGAWRQLCTLHPNGGSASFTYFPPDTPWMDFQMYHSSHSDNNEVTYERALEGWALTPIKPIVNGEPAFEDMYDGFWLVNKYNRDQFRRLDDQNVRFAQYTSILSGALGGTAYGANGIFQWGTPNDSGSHFPRYLLDDAWGLPGSSQMTIMRQFMEHIRWYNLVPKPDALLDHVGKYHPSVAATDSLLVVYLPKLTQYVRLESLFGNDSTLCYWFNPRSSDAAGNFTVQMPADSNGYMLVPPDTNDWVAVLSVTPFVTAVRPPPLPSAGTVDVYPNPCKGHSSIRCSTPFSGDASITVYNVLGKNIAQYTFHVLPGTFIRQISLPEAGTYFLTIRLPAEGNGDSVSYRTLLSN